jgi:hypothetical protein
MQMYFYFGINANIPLVALFICCMMLARDANRVNTYGKTMWLAGSFDDMLLFGLLLDFFNQGGS